MHIHHMIEMTEIVGDFEVGGVWEKNGDSGELNGFILIKEEFN